MAAKFEALAPRLGGQEVFVASVWAVAEEADIVCGLDRVVAEHPDVEIGSYPHLERGRWILWLTVESVDRPAVEAATEALARALGDRVTTIDPIASTSPGACSA